MPLNKRKQNGRKDKKVSFTHIETFNIYMIYIQVILKERIQEFISTDIYTNCSMNTQYEEGVQMKKAYLTSVVNIAMYRVKQCFHR